MGFSKYLFWEVDVNKIDFQNKKHYVIERALDMGQINDWDMLKELYDRETIKKVALNIRNLDPKTLSFLSNIFNIPKEQFRCYTLTQLNQTHWRY